MNKEVKLGNIMIDCKDDLILQEFYHQLLHWEKVNLYGCLGIKSSTGILFLFSKEEDFIEPIWPEEENKQQKQIHFDFQFNNIEEAKIKAIQLGAHIASNQYGDTDFITMIDPSGHPFCICKSDE